MTLTKDKVREFMRDADEALRAVAERHGLTAKPCRATYDPAGTIRFRCEANAVEKRADGVVVDGDARAFQQLASLVGLRPEDLGARFRSGGNEYRVVGMRTKASKRPILAEDARTGKKFVFAAEDVIRALGRTPRDALFPATPVVPVSSAPTFAATGADGRPTRVTVPEED